jgi:hypothetical protein
MVQSNSFIANAQHNESPTECVVKLEKEAQEAQSEPSWTLSIYALV